MIIATTETPVLLMLVLALGTALAFEFVNGFHDTANAVATVIYTNSLKPSHAVFLSGFCNFLGVLLGGVAVAYSIVHLLPVDLLVRTGPGSLAMVFALLLAAVVWNLGTWYVGLPASSSHTLIGSILGVGFANGLFSGLPLESCVNWYKVTEVVLSLLISPMVGFGCAGVLLLVLRWGRPGRIHEPAKDDQPPPGLIRSVLIFCSAGVSFTHGSNDGQKGIGLIMLILIGMLPAYYSINMDLDGGDVRRVETAALSLRSYFEVNSSRVVEAMTMDDKMRAGAFADEKRGRFYFIDCGLPAAAEAARTVLTLVEGRPALSTISDRDRWFLRGSVLCLDEAADRAAALIASTEDKARIKQWQKDLRRATEFAPQWVMIAVSLALGVGTMIGYRRIVVTIGEKIGRDPLTYAQGAAAQIVAMATIASASVIGMPVSTTHVLSSGIAGTMAANRSGLQAKTLLHIVAAWVTTLPASMALAAGLYMLFRVVV